MPPSTSDGPLDTLEQIRDLLSEMLSEHRGGTGKGDGSGAGANTNATTPGGQPKPKGDDKDDEKKPRKPDSFDSSVGLLGSLGGAPAELAALLKRMQSIGERTVELAQSAKNWWDGPEKKEDKPQPTPAVPIPVAAPAPIIPDGELKLQPPEPAPWAPLPPLPSPLVAGTPLAQQPVPTPATESLQPLPSPLVASNTPPTPEPPEPISPLRIEPPEPLPPPEPVRIEPPEPLPPPEPLLRAEPIRPPDVPVLPPERLQPPTPPLLPERLELAPAVQAAPLPGLATDPDANLPGRSGDRDGPVSQTAPVLVPGAPGGASGSATPQDSARLAAALERLVVILDKLGSGRDSDEQGNRDETEKGENWQPKSMWTSEGGGKGSQHGSAFHSEHALPPAAVSGEDKKGDLVPGAGTLAAIGRMGRAVATRLMGS